MMRLVRLLSVICALVLSVGSFAIADNVDATSIDFNSMSTSELLTLVNSLAEVLDDRGYVLTVSEEGTDENAKAGTVNQNDEEEQFFAYMHDRWNLYRASFISDTIVKIERWHRFSADAETPFELEHSITTFNISDGVTDFCWLNDAHTAFTITIADDSNSKFQEPRQVAFSLESGTGLPSYTYQHDRWNLYKATVHSNAIVVDCWYRFEAKAGNPFFHDHGVLVVNFDDPNAGFAWLDDAHTSFSIMLSDDNKSGFSEPQLVVFALEN